MKADAASHYREIAGSKVEALGGRFGYAWIALAFFVMGRSLFGRFSCQRTGITISRSRYRNMSRR
jgi:hypothetical protein